MITAMATSNRGMRSKPRFYDWLIAQINSNRFTGVFWLDDEHNTFRIPWKSLKLNVFEEDVAIFKAWAFESLKYNEAVNDQYKWKHNFHSALKSITVNGQRVFTEVHNYSRHPADPHKVFRIHQAGALGSAPEGSSTASGRHHIGLNTHAEGRGQNNIQNPPQDASAPLDQELTRVFEAISFLNAVTAEETIFNTHDWAQAGSTQMVAVASRASLIAENQPEENSFYGFVVQPTSNLPVEYNPIQRDFTCPPALYHSTIQSPQSPQSPRGQIPFTIQPPCPVEQMPNNLSGNTPLTQDEQLADSWTNGTRNIPEEVSFFINEDDLANIGTTGSSYTPNSFAGPAAAFLEKPPNQNSLLHGAVADQSHSTASVKSPCRKRARSYKNDSSNNEQAVPDPSANGISQGAGATLATLGLSSAMVRQDAIHHGLAPPAVDDNWKPDDLLCCLQLNIYYRRKHVLHLPVNHNRCRLSYNQVISNFGPHEPVCFPSPAHLPDQKQVQYTTRILEAIEEGLLLEVNRDQKKVYATWLGSPHYKVFWASDGQLARLASIPPIPLPEFLQKNIATEIFNFQTFLKELEEYTKGRRRSPDFTIYLCFGQKFSVNKPKEEKLVLVEIVPQYCLFWYEFVQQRGVSSLNSVIASLQIPSLFQLIEMMSSRGW